ncbi:restriction endonuclease subunit S [Dehalobacterium formicoaceticum]|uniref:Restriction endonuclease subunit S n=1 Tax=Dehalobacterium formicoaceticum TaxID=51515 RepID=A0ABT1Y5A6_9FIRM|nr:restriction endonuclease subunit S [Dehalobacterium formicoaceticum]MCR6545686.1 restriction endonuclease subunit S [Dehalobacterium formicoaceticum]
MSFNKSKTEKLGNIAYVQTGPFGSQLHKSDYIESGTPIITVEHLGKRRVSRDSMPYVSENDRLRLNKYSLKNGDLVFSRVGSVDRCSYISEEEDGWLFSGRCLRVRANINKLYPQYLYYYFCLESMKEYIRSIAVGATMPSINTKILCDVDLTIPSVSEQKKIAETLSCLDDKIELNNRINKTLEEMAQAIFKSWFVDFEPFQDGEFEDSELGKIPKGWRVGALSDIADITMGQSPKGSSYNENADGKVFYQGRTDFGNRYPMVRLYTTEPKRLADKGDVLLSVRAPVGDINVAGEDCCIGRGLASLKSKTNCSSYLLYQLLNLKDNFNIYNGEGTVFGSINKDTLNNMQVLIPSEKDIQEFQYRVGKIDDVIESNSLQIKILTAIRDTLLPKLMSGEIRVPIEEVQ